MKKYTIPIQHKIKYYFTCPECRKNEFEISHLMEKKSLAGPRYCDNCGNGYLFKIKDDLFLDVEHYGKEIKNINLLKFEEEEPFYLLVNGSEYIRNGEVQRTGESIIE
ncbi:MAG: hypothetical protein KGL53_10395, partial [Elusimicrobia bacterium]|nr:hypothetical protein [Elusimicrobiota bacterium]